MIKQSLVRIVTKLSSTLTDSAGLRSTQSEYIIPKFASWTRYENSNRLSSLPRISEFVAGRSREQHTLRRVTRLN
jgi:hypothetical protein